MILLSLALAPVVFLASFVYLKDTYNREPLRHLIISFILGVFSTMPALLIETFWANVVPKDTLNIPLTFFWAFIIVALTEELVKWLVLNFYAYKQKEFDEPYDGIIYGVMISLGFAALENILYVAEGGVSVALLRMFTAVPAHASFGVMMGYYFGMAWQHKEQAWQYKIRGLLIAVILHGIYDFFLFQQNYPAFAFFSFLGLVVSIRLAVKAIKKHQNNSPFSENVIKGNNF